MLIAWGGRSVTVVGLAIVVNFVDGMSNITGPARFSDLGQFSVGKTIMKTRLPNILDSTSASETHNIG